MKSIQYTIRSIPSKIDHRLRVQAKQSGKSLNEIVVQTLAKGTGVEPNEKVYHDLDWFKGSLSEKEVRQWEESMKWLDSAPKEIK